MSESRLRQERESWLRPRIEQYCDGLLSSQEAAELDRRLCDDPEALESFLLYMALHARIAWNARSRTAYDGNAPMGPRTAPAATAGDAPAAHPSSFTVHPFNNPSAYFPSIFGGVVWSYICAALFLGIGVVAARLWDPAGDPTQLVRDAVLAPAQTAANSAPVIVGKVAAMSNCQWLDPQTAAREGEPVARGRSYVLTSGLLQITYNTGARAILQGPAVYTVDAPNGGSLSLGKLTVEAGMLDRAAMAESEKARGHPAPPPRAAAFCVRTHSAIVLDKGDQDAEFGVEVDRSWVTYTRVLRGKVIFASPGFEPCSIPVGMCVWTGAGAKRNGLFIFKPGPESLIFATEMPKAPPVCVAKPASKENQRRAGGG